VEYAQLVAEYSELGAYDFEAEAMRVMAGLGLDESLGSRSVDSLSGGERARLDLARCLLADAALLLLDEPDNHLDVEGIRWLEQYILDYKGCVLIASHDRAMLNSVANCVIELEVGRARLEHGDLSDYFMRKQQRLDRQRIEY